HVMREYAVSPLEVLFVRDVMATDVVTFKSGSPLAELHEVVLDRSVKRGQRLIPVIEENERMVGVVPWADVLERLAGGTLTGSVDEIMRRDVVVAFPDEPLRTVAERMAERRLGVLPVVERGRPDRLRGIVTQFDLLRARERTLQEERHRERVLSVRVLPRA